MKIGERKLKEPVSGILYDLGSQLIDQTQVLFGLQATVTADVRRDRDGTEVDDNFEVILHYPMLNLGSSVGITDLKVTLKASMLTKIPGPRFILHGTEGSFVKYGLDPQEEALKKGRTPTDSDWGVSSEDDRGRLVTKVGDLEIDSRVKTLPGCYQEFYSNVADAIRFRKELIVKPETALNTIRIIELAKKSSDSGRSVPFDGEKE